METVLTKLVRIAVVGSLAFRESGPTSFNFFLCPYLRTFLRLCPVALPARCQVAGASGSTSKSTSNISVSLHRITSGRGNISIIPTSCHHAQWPIRRLRIEDVDWLTQEIMKKAQHWLCIPFVLSVDKGDMWKCRLFPFIYLLSLR